MTAEEVTDIVNSEVLILDISCIRSGQCCQLVNKQVVNICGRYQVFRGVRLSLIDLMVRKLLQIIQY